jgi:ketosteroid isomerase-like protein
MPPYGPAMTAELTPPAGIIRSFFASFDDPDRTKALVHPEAELIGVRAGSYPDLPLYGTFVGHDGLERFVAGLRRAFETELFAIDHVLEDAEAGFASGRFRHRVRSTGAVLQSHWAVACRFDAGRIVRYRFFEDTAALEQAFGVHTTCRETVHAEP